jgi:DNA polymerase I-like protein with 3'-5' exonuclease and polymerase domains
MQDLEAAIIKRFPYVPGKVFTPKRQNKAKGYVAGAPFTKLLDFNPTSRLNIAWALQQFRGARFTRLTDSGKPKVDEACLAEIRDLALQQKNELLHEECEMFIRLLTLQKWLGQLSEGANSWFNTIEQDNCIHHSCSLATQTGRNAHRGPNLGQVVSAPWARQLFIPHPGHVMVGADLEGLELRALGHYLSVFDEGAFADVVLNGDIHQQNADRVGCTRKEVKTLTYAFIYGAGDVKMGHSLSPELSDPQKKQLGQELRRKFLDAIPGLEPLIDAVKQKVRDTGRLRGLDGRPIFCRAEHASLNYLLQSCGAILSKRWVVVGQDLLNQAGLTYNRDYTRCAYVHDEVQLSVVPTEADHVAELLVKAAPIAGQYYKFRVPITAAADTGASWQDTH